MITVFQRYNSKGLPFDHRKFVGDVIQGPHQFPSREEFIQWMEEKGFALIAEGQILEIHRKRKGQPSWLKWKTK